MGRENRGHTDVQRDLAATESRDESARLWDAASSQYRGLEQRDFLFISRGHGPLIKHLVATDTKCTKNLRGGGSTKNTLRLLLFLSFASLEHLIPIVHHLVSNDTAVIAVTLF